MSEPIRVLVVDDDLVMRHTVRAVLEDEGFAVEECGSSRETKALLASSPLRFDVVMLDRHLGDGDGVGLLPAVRAAQQGAKVVLISGESCEATVTARFDAALTKGDDVRVLLSTLRQLARGDTR